MPQAPPGIAQGLVSLVQFSEGHVICVAAAGVRVRMRQQCLGVERFLQRLELEPGPARLIEQGEVIRHAAKLSPQEQCATAFGLVTLKPPFCRSSL